LNNKQIITCRVSATDYSFEKFSYVEIADFSPDQVGIYSRKWFVNQPQKGDVFLDELKKEENHGLRELAQTPILLNLLCLNFDETLYFPVRLVDLYQEAIDALLKKWDSSRNIKRDEIYRTLSVTRKQQLLAHIAAEFFDRKEIFFAEKDIVKIVDEYLKTLPGFQGDIDGETILKSIEAQHGLLVERAHRIHSFSHLTFQEYFVARYIIENGSDKVLLRLMSHLSDKNWHEVFLMVVSLLPHADNFFSVMASTLQEIKDYSFPIRLARMLRELHSLSPTKRLTFFYVSSAFKLNIQSEVYKIKLLLDDAYWNERLDDLPNAKRKVSQVVEAVLSLGSDMDERLTPYDLLEALDSIRLPLSYFMNSKVILSEKYSMERIISIVDEINMKIKTHINRARKYAQDLVSILDEVRKDGRGKSKKDLSDVHSRWSEIRSDLSKAINNINTLLYKIDSAMEFSFSREGAEWVFTHDEIGELLNYIYIQKLFLECLKVASVSDRKNIIEKIFLQ
jgi:predicted NACHT family NTPase